MSGNFVQRGEPAVFDKYIRARTALLGGADLVLELSSVFACSSAGHFASSAIKTLEAANIADYLVFGAEDPLYDLSQTAQALTQNERMYNDKLREYLGQGMSYPRARANALPDFADILSKPNNILALEYLSALSTDITPIAIKRTCPHHSDKIGAFAAAGAIRKQIHAGKHSLIRGVVPDFAYNLYKDAPIHHIDNMSMILQYILKTSSTDDLREIAGVVEGMEHRILKSASKYFLVSDIITDVKTKRYTFTKISRTILHIILGITKKNYEKHQEEPPYIRVLGFRKNSKLLKKLTENARAPVIMNLKNAGKQIETSGLQKETEMSDMYYLTRGEAAGNGYDFRQQIIIV